MRYGAGPPVITEKSNLKPKAIEPLRARPFPAYSSQCIQVWDRMVPAIWRLCLWLIEILPTRMNSTGSAETGVAEVQAGLRGLVISLYEGVPSMQETLLSSLLNRCFRNASMSPMHLIHASTPRLRSPRGAPDSGGIASAYSVLASIPSLEHSFEDLGGGTDSMLPAHGAHEGISSGSTLADALPRRAFHPPGSGPAGHLLQAFLAATILERLVKNHTEVGSAVLTAIINRLQPAGDGKITLPPPVILHR